ncbi:DUF5681 domain-containing protein [uncultured Nitratireductor sp.]|uniref:DUF5681 domain-containing protein n=1 Tax=uncultured Nitratireductor sp. TaxID=520953 RepID=UPI0025F112C2|nr:DUF5681 domain-containing protein [uncultured Nitratireductor sp.]
MEDSDEKGPTPPVPGVGYRNPPVEHRFKPGQSGNPKGRPKKRSALAPKASKKKTLEILREEAQRYVWVTEGGKRSQIEYARVLFRQMGAAAAKDAQMARLLMKLIMEAEATSKDPPQLDLSQLSDGELEELIRIQNKMQL